MSGQSAPTPGHDRYVLLDVFRGLLVTSMVLYHAMYDLVYEKGFSIPWYPALPGYVWQQSICWCFILLSGFCWSLSRRHIKRGLLLVGCGAVITLVTYFIMPSELIQYGILTLLGLSALLLALLELLRRKAGLSVPPQAGLAAAVLLFFLTRNVPYGGLGFEGLHLASLPAGLYSSDLFAVLGFHSPTFVSSDYFSLIPWFFLYLCGFFLWGVLSRRPAVLQALRRPLPILEPVQRFFAWVGRRSLLIYLLHQPVLLGIFLLL